MPGPGQHDSDVWERRPDESDPAWEAFAAFRDMKPGTRSLAEVARQLSKSRPLITRWAGRYGWQMRAAAFDRELDRQWREQTAVLRREAAERDSAVAGVMLNKVVARLQSIDPNSLTARDCATWVEVATKIRRLALGDPTEIQGQTGDGSIADPTLMTPEERRVRLEQLVREGERRLKAVPNAS